MRVDAASLYQCERDEEDEGSTRREAGRKELSSIHHFAAVLIRRLPLFPSPPLLFTSTSILILSSEESLEEMERGDDRELEGRG